MKLESIQRFLHTKVFDSEKEEIFQLKKQTECQGNDRERTSLRLFFVIECQRYIFNEFNILAEKCKLLPRGKIRVA